MNLSQKQRDELWGDDGPYSQASIIIQSRILDDKVSRVFIEVETDINPLTYKIIEQNRDRFKDDIKIQQLLDHAEYRGPAFGYVTSAFSREYVDESVMNEAKQALEYTKETIIKMHKFVMEILDIESEK
jgi:hypothetical protein